MIQSGMVEAKTEGCHRRIKPGFGLSAAGGLLRRGSRPATRSATPKTGCRALCFFARERGLLTGALRSSKPSHLVAVRRIGLKLANQLALNDLRIGALA
jgi:hypothetical protein